jgi:transcriptional repressor NF-X1
MSSSASTQPAPDATTGTSHVAGRNEVSEPLRNRGQRGHNPGGASDPSSRNDTRRHRQNAGPGGGQRRQNNSRGPGRNARLLASPTALNSELLDTTLSRPQSIQPESTAASTPSQPNNHRRTSHPSRGRPTNAQGQDPNPGQRRRAARFNPALSEPAAGVSGKDAPTPAGGNASRKRTRAPPGDDLTSILTFALSNPPYPECMICFNPILPGHPSWSCSPKEEKDAQSCWNTFHLKCIKPWAEKSVKDTEEAWRARGEERKGEWRCPGCQSKREIVPRKYWWVVSSTDGYMRTYTSYPGASVVQHKTPNLRDWQLPTLAGIRVHELGLVDILARYLVILGPVLHA